MAGAPRETMLLLPLQAPALWSWIYCVLLGQCLWQQIAAIELNTEESIRMEVAKRPRNLEARMKLINWHMQWGEINKASNELKRSMHTDTLHAPQYATMLGDITYKYMGDEKEAAGFYQKAIEADPNAREAIIQLGQLSIWNDRRDFANKMFEDAKERGMLRDIRQRPLMLSRDPSEAYSTEPWLNIDGGSNVGQALLKLEEAMPDILAEYLKWARTRAKDAEVDEEGITARHVKKSWKHYWIHRPKFDRGIWHDSCSYKTPKTCSLLKSINNTGRTASKLVIYQADFDVLSPGGEIRPHCYISDTETFVLLPLLVPRLGPGRLPGLKVGGDERPFIEGRTMLYDATFENQETLPMLPNSVDDTDHDYAEDLREFYEKYDMKEKIETIPAILDKWKGQEEKMMRKVREKHLEGWKSERVMLRLLVRSSILKAFEASPSPSPPPPEAGGEGDFGEEDFGEDAADEGVSVSVEEGGEEEEGSEEEGVGGAGGAGGAGGEGGGGAGGGEEEARGKERYKDARGSEL